MLATLGDDPVAKNLTTSLARPMRCLVQTAILDSSQDLQHVSGFDLVIRRFPMNGKIKVSSVQTAFAYVVPASFFS